VLPSYYAGGVLMSVGEVGAVCFGVVVGWIVYRTLRRSSDKVRLSDIATVIGAVGGAAVTTPFDNESLFGCYSIGLAAGFFGYLILGNTVFKNSAWLGGD
jgi:NhaP-type Na+/H+ or K+/H+ antiporter